MYVRKRNLVGRTRIEREVLEDSEDFWREAQRKRKKRAIATKAVQIQQRDQFLQILAIHARLWVHTKGSSW